MKVTLNQLRRLIKEEARRTLRRKTLRESKGMELRIPIPNDEFVDFTDQAAEVINEEFPEAEVYQEGDEFIVWCNDYSVLVAVAKRLDELDDEITSYAQSVPADQDSFSKYLPKRK